MFFCVYGAVDQNVAVVKVDGGWAGGGNNDGGVVARLE